jgi:signal transduction histidine kinase
MFFKGIQNNWRVRGLRTKVLLPILGLMAVSLIISVFAFVFGTLQTRNQLIEQQFNQDQGRVMQVFSSREGIVRSGSAILANSPEVYNALLKNTDNNLSVLDSSAVVLRNRLSLDLIQIYTAQGEMRVNLVLSKLFRVSNLLQEINDGQTLIKEIDGRLILLSRESIGGAGVVITGIDLETELGRISSRENLTSNAGFEWGNKMIVSRPIDQAAFQRGDIVRWSKPVTISGKSLLLVLYRQTAEINRVTGAGLLVMVLSSIFTTLLLGFFANRLSGAIASPIQQLAKTARLVEKEHQFKRIELQNDTFHLFGVGQQDEIGQLAFSFNRMLDELEDLYQNLENKVEVRTRQVEAAAEVARATTSSLNLQEVLQTAVDMICSRFDMYFAGVFIRQPESDLAILQCSTGGLEKITQHGIRIPLQQSSHITQAIKTRKPVIVQQVSASPNYLAHALLPATQSEAVFPLVHGEVIIGVLNIQSDQEDAFTPELIEMFSTLSDQLSVAIEHAQLFDHQREIASRLAEIDHAKTQFLASISDGLSSPLNAIVLATQTLLSETEGKLSDRQRMRLALLYNETQNLREVVNDVLDLSRLEAGKMELHIQPFALKDEILNACAAGRQQLGNKPIWIETDLPPVMPLVLGDKMRIRQVLDNLISNAIKYTETGRIQVNASANQQWVIVDINDTGIGIPPEKVERLFQPFATAAPSGRRKLKGIGLGLVITRYILELHGGKIWAESELGAGSTFSFVLPVESRLEALVVGPSAKLVKV